MPKTPGEWLPFVLAAVGFGYWMLTQSMKLGRILQKLDYVTDSQASLKRRVTKAEESDAELKQRVTVLENWRPKFP